MVGGVSLTVMVGVTQSMYQTLDDGNQVCMCSLICRAGFQLAFCMHTEQSVGQSINHVISQSVSQSFI